MKSLKINQLKITIIDNMPNMLENHWYDPGFNTKYNKKEYSGRYKLNLWMLTSQRPIQLQSTLSWPPSDLARRQRWRDCRDFYEQQRTQAQALKDDVNRPSPLPPLLGMPTEYQRLGVNTTGKNIHKWYVPRLPSLIRSQYLRNPDNSLYWLVHWIMPGETREFVIDQTDCKVELWDNKQGGKSKVYMKTYAHAFDIDPDYYRPSSPEHFVQENIDHEYEEFKARVRHLYAQAADEEALAVLNRHPVYAERWLREAAN